MLGVIVVIIISGLILWVTSRKQFTVLGIKPNRLRIKEFSTGFLFMAVFCTLNILGQAYFQKISYSLNPNFNFWQGLSGIWWTARAVLFEELIFRGVLLYLLIKKIGIVKACILGAVAFGIYHWFSYGMFGGRIFPMIYVFLLTGAGGWVFSYAFAKTKSLFAPLGLHFGWIVISIVLFSEGPLGNQFLIPNGEKVELGGWVTLLFFTWQAIVIPFLVTWYLKKNYSSNE